MKKLSWNAALAVSIMLLLAYGGCAHQQAQKSQPINPDQPQTIGDLLGETGANPTAPTAQPDPAAKPRPGPTRPTLTPTQPNRPPVRRYRPHFRNRRVKDHLPRLQQADGTPADALRQLRALLRQQSEKQASQTQTRLNQEMRAFYQAWNLVQLKHVSGPYPSGKMVEAAIRGLLKVTKDRHTRYLSAKELKEFEASDSGEFGGIGIAMRWLKKEQRLLVEKVMTGTPAAKSGLMAGDEIVLVDGKPVKKLGLSETAKRIRGAVGTTVRLTIKRSKVRRLLQVLIIRAKIISRTVEYRILLRNGKRLFHITVQNFHRPTIRDFKRAVRRAQMWQADGIILDLRFNPGGYVHVTRILASAWLEPNQILFHEIKPATKRVTVTIGSYPPVTGAFKGLPTVVLVNRYSASASEILAGTLQDYGRATVVGEKTYGKGSVQTRHALANGGAVMVTIRHWLTPKDRKINGVGLQPDIKVPWKPEAAISGFGKPGDPQLQRAIDLLTGKKPAVKTPATPKAAPKKKRARP